MRQEEMVIRSAALHILDPLVGMPVLSQGELELGSDLSEFLKAHVERFTESDERKLCRFQEESEVGRMLQDWTPEAFVPLSGQLAERLFQVLSENAAIPPADAVVLWLSAGAEEYLAFLKMDYKSSYTHATSVEEGANVNSILLQKALLPSRGQRVSEAFLYRFSDGDLQVVEKRHEVNGEKRWYFSELFLQCRAPMSPKARLDLVTRAVEQVNRKYYGEEDPQRQMEIKNAVYQELGEEGGLRVETLKEKVFAGSPKLQEELEEKLEPYHLAEETVELRNPQTLRKYQKQRLLTDTGIEITIPMEEYENPDRVEFLTNPDGTISVLIKNVGRLSAR